MFIFNSSFGHKCNNDLLKYVFLNILTKGNWTVPGGCIVASMELGITVPTNPEDLNKTLELTVDPSKNITVKGSCPKNATKEVYVRLQLRLNSLNVIKSLDFLCHLQVLSSDSVTIISLEYCNKISMPLISLTPPKNETTYIIFH